MTVTFKKPLVVLVSVIVIAIIAVNIIVPMINRNEFKRFYEDSLNEILMKSGMSIDNIEYMRLEPNYDNYPIKVDINVGDAGIEEIYRTLREIELFENDYGVDDNYKLIDDNDSSEREYNGYNFLDVDHYIGGSLYNAWRDRLEVDGRVVLENNSTSQSYNTNTPLTYEDLAGTGFHNTRPNSPAEDNEIKAYLMKCVECGNHTDNGGNSRCDFCRERAKKSEENDWT